MKNIQIIPFLLGLFFGEFWKKMEEMGIFVAKKWLSHKFITQIINSSGFITILEHNTLDSIDIFTIFVT